MVPLEAGIERKDIAFLLGAGASVNAGLKTAMQLTELLEESLLKDYPALIEPLRFIQGAIQFGRACRNEPITGKTNIEEILSICSQLTERQYSHIYPFVSSWHERISQLQDLPEGIEVPEYFLTMLSTEDSNNSFQKKNQKMDTFQFLKLYCKDKLREWLEVKEPPKTKYLRSLTDFSKKKNYRLRIFTLNYDDAVELAFKDAYEGDINNKWTTGFTEAGWNPELFENNGLEAYLYKLHGSLDWVNDKKLKICSTQWPSAVDSEELPDRYDPLLIFGTDFKLQPRDPFMTLLYHFQQALRKTQVLIVIGYSFGDFHINSMIMEALQRDPQMRCICVNRGSLDEILCQPLKRYDNRFIEINEEAKVALESDSLLNKVDEVFQTFTEELPF